MGRERGERERERGRREIGERGREGGRKGVEWRGEEGVEGIGMEREEEESDGEESQ